MRSILILPLILFATSSHAQTHTTHFKGYAFSSNKKDKIVYTEHHQRTYSSGQLITSKTDYVANGKTIAVLECDYSKNQVLPDFVFEDLRTGYWETGRILNAGVEIKFRDDRFAPVQTKKFDSYQNYSASQGLNELIKQNLTILGNNQKVVTKFLLPARMTDVEMLITGEKVASENTRVYISLNNFILRFFAPRLELTYSPTNRLLNYYGNSNLLTDAGEQQKVYIEYEYESHQEVAAHAKAYQFPQ